MAVRRRIQDFFHALREGDAYVRLSLLFCGLGYFRRGQIVKGIIMTVFQAVTVLAVLIALPFFRKFNTLGTVMRESVYNPETKRNETNDYDHSFQILLYGLIGMVVLLACLIIWLGNIIRVRRLQVLAEQGKHINSFIDDIREYKNQKFHITLLFFPVTGVLIFSIIPILVLILVAFTNYDQNHMPPSALFTWVGWENFRQLFSFGSTASFGYSFRNIIIWTFIWAFFATFTNYFGGILLSLLINHRDTRLKKMWRGLFVVTIAVPQFVSLLLVRNFFSNSGIVNTILNNLGVTKFLQNIGLVNQSLSYIPFLTDPNWAKFMIILINVWVGVPYLMLIATGVLMNIPVDLTESARIDGANSFQVFRKITMPYMLFVTGPYLVTSFVSNINNFNVIYLLTQDVYITMNQTMANAKAKETDLLINWLFRLTNEYYNYKMASVIGIIVFIICAVFTLLAFNTMIRGNREERFQ